MKNVLLFAFSFLLLIACNQDESYFVNEIDSNSTTRPDGGVDRPDDCDFIAPIYDNVTTPSDLIEQLQLCFTPTTSFSYSQARTYLYSDVDVIDGKLQTIYTNYKTEIIPGPADSYINAASKKGINCEHVFPQSKGAGEVPARSDMYHIYPALADVNTARSAYVFADIENNSGVTWFKELQTTNSKPSDESTWSKGKIGAFEPRDDKKGDVARSVFYFYTIYNTEADQSFFNDMRSTLIKWHKEDPVSNEERIRADKIAELQGNYNPYILDEDLVDRVFIP